MAVIAQAKSKICACANYSMLSDSSTQIFSELKILKVYDLLEFKLLYNKSSLSHSMLTLNHMLM